MKKRLSLIKCLLLVSSLLILTISCNTAKKDWEKAQQQNSVVAYNDFITKHPESEFLTEAKNKVIELDWEKAQQEKTIEAFTKFIDNHPDSKYIAEAKQNIYDLSYTWEDGFLNKEYMENPKKISQAFSKILNQENSMIVGYEKIENGSITSYLGSLTGVVTFTNKNIEGGIKIQVKQIEKNGILILGIKVNDGDKNVSMQLHEVLINNLKKN